MDCKDAPPDHEFEVGNFQAVRHDAHTFFSSLDIELQLCRQSKQKEKKIHVKILKIQIEFIRYMHYH